MVKGIPLVLIVLAGSNISLWEFLFWCSMGLWWLSIVLGDKDK
jgi:hypothetical protein